MSEYTVKFEVFEGPLDLLLYLIRKEEVDIYEVNLTKLASQFVDRPGGGFFGGVVVGGYHAAPPFGDNSGFASFCLGTAHTATARVLSAPSYGATGARDLRLRLLDHTRRVVLGVPE